MSKTHTSIGAAMPEGLDSFERDRVAGSLSETGRKVDGSFFLLCLLLAVASVLTFTEVSENRARVPLLELGLERLLAAQVVSVLSCAAYFQLAAFLVYERLLGVKLQSLIRESGGQRKYRWYLLAPSIFTFLNSIGNYLPNPIRYVLLGFLLLLQLGGLGFPLYLFTLRG